MRRPLIVLSISAALTFGSITARAQGPEAAADVAFQEGRAALSKGNFELACSKLAESDRLLASGRAVLNLADCFERRGMIAAAHAKFVETAERAVQANRPDAERHARDRAARLEARLPRVSLVVPKDAVVPGLEIKHNGQIVPKESWGAAVAVDPGTTHELEATAPGRTTWTASVVAEEGKTARVELRWAEIPRASAKPEPVPASAPVEANHRGETKSTKNPLAYGLLGIGVVGIGVGTFAGIQVLNAKSTVASHCNGAARTCDREGFDATSRGKTFSIMSPVALGAGVVALAAGGYLLLHRSGSGSGSGSGGEKSSRQVGVTPSLSPTSGSITVSGTF